MDLNFHSSQAETINGVSDSFNRSDMVLVGLFVAVTDAEGILPSLVVKLQHSPDNVNWYNVGAISVTTAVTGTFSSAPAALALLADYVRCSWTITGTNPSFIFSIDVVTHDA